jgi:hypothetical protein
MSDTIEQITSYLVTVSEELPFGGYLLKHRIYRGDYEHDTGVTAVWMLDGKRDERVHAYQVGETMFDTFEDALAAVAQDGRTPSA